MATRQPDPSPTSPAELHAECPQCKGPCLGPTILPCAHLACRKCLHDLLEQHGSQRSCRACTRHLPSLRDQGSNVSQLVGQCGQDPIVWQQTDQHLQQQKDVRCVFCSNKKAVCVCQDCQENYCDICSSLHQRQKVSKDHVQQLLPQALSNTSTVNRATAPRPRSFSVTSTASVDSIRNPDDPQSRGQSGGRAEWKEWVRKEVELLQQAESEQDEVMTAVQQIVAEGQQLLYRVQSHKALLHIYREGLPLLDFCHSTGPNAYVISPNRDDVRLDVKTESFGKRLSDVREGRHSPGMKDMEPIRTRLSHLLHATDKADADLGSGAQSQVSVRPLYTPTPPASAADVVTGKGKQVSKSTPTSGDAMTAKVKQVFMSTFRSDDDKYKPSITSIVSTQHGTLVMAERNNSKVKVIDRTDPDNVSASVTLDVSPWALAVLSDGLVAVTTGKDTIYLLRVEGHVTVTSRLLTDRRYWGVAPPSDDTLIVSCDSDESGSARVDVITRQGEVVRTLTDSDKLPGLECPDHLCVLDQCVLVSDGLRHTVYTVNVSSGELMETLTHTDMKHPYQVCVDSDSNLYVACWADVKCGGGRCVLVRSARGQWRRLLQAPDHTVQDYDRPRCVCVTSWGEVVVAWSKVSDSVVIGYTLM